MNAVSGSRGAGCPASAAPVSALCERLAASVSSTTCCAGSSAADAGSDGKEKSDMGGLAPASADAVSGGRGERRATRADGAASRAA
eukprot:361200-Chlamydomonas_euryale.AAC.28